MFRTLHTLLLGTIALSVFAQNVAISSDGSSPDPSAILQVISSDKGVLFPRMNTTQMNAIASPAEGLMVFNTDSAEYLVYNGSAWSAPNSPSPYSVGDVLSEGTVFYVDDANRYALVYDASDLSSDDWGCSGTDISGATSTNDGESNTAAIVAGCGDLNFAAKICDNSSSGGFTDWYLPSYDEMQLIYDYGSSNLNVNNPYWTSTQVSASNAYTFRFDSGSFTSRSKGSWCFVRAIRKRTF